MESMGRLGIEVERKYAYAYQYMNNSRANLIII